MIKCAARWLVLAGVPLALALAGVSASAQEAAIPEPPVTAPASLMQVQEFQLHGPLLERLQQSWPDLNGLERMVVRRYRPAEGAPSDALHSALGYYRDTLRAKRWLPLIEEHEQRDSAALSSPDGTALMAIKADRGHLLVSVVYGRISLEHIPKLERIMSRALGSMKFEVAAEDQKAITRARELFDSGQKQQAVDVLGEALRERPRSLYVRRQLADFYGKMNRQNDQLEQLRSAVAIAPTGYYERLSYARALYETKDLKSALFEFSQAAALAPDRGTPRYYIGRIYEDMGKLDDAVTAYEQADKLAPHWLSIPVRLGGVYERQEKWQDADAAYERALKRDSRCEEARRGHDRVNRHWKGSDSDKDGNK